MVRCGAGGVGTGAMDVLADECVGTLVNDGARMASAVLIDFGRSPCSRTPVHKFH